MLHYWKFVNFILNYKYIFIPLGFALLFAFVKILDSDIQGVLRNILLVIVGLPMITLSFIGYDAKRSMEDYKRYLDREREEKESNKSDLTKGNNDRL